MVARSIWGVLMLFAVLLFVPLGVLGSAIGWPDSLKAPAAVMLPKLLEHKRAVQIGYGAFLLQSLLLLPSAAILVHHAGGGNARGRDSLVMLTMAFAAVSVLARCMGIVRWLGPAMTLADQHDKSDANARKVIEMSQDTINLYVGTVGEVLGDAWFGGLFLLTVSIYILRTNGLPRWLGLAGLPISLVVMAPGLEILGLPHPVGISLSSASLQLWMIVAGLVIMWRALNRVKNCTHGVDGLSGDESGVDGHRPSRPRSSIG